MDVALDASALGEIRHDAEHVKQKPAGGKFGELNGRRRLFQDAGMRSVIAPESGGRVG